MNWDDLRYFLALVRNQSVSGAGRNLNVKHTTVARRIAALEEQLGSRLFDRTPSGYLLTQVGENLLPYAVSVEEKILKADREVFGMDQQLSGSLKLASSYDLFTRLIIPKLNTFIVQYPSIELELISSAGLVDLNSREADIALRISPNPPEYLVGKKIATLAHGIYASESYLEQKVSQQRIILWRQDVNSHWVTQHFPNAASITRTGDVMTMMELVRNDVGIARLPCYVADSETVLRRLDIPLTNTDWGVWVLSHIDLKSTARVRACRNFLIDTITSQQRLIEGKKSLYWHE
ncbi:LysR family transcriptional regulator [Shewanella sp. SG41-4]|uniref:LysR family transcriptional regulator n=1 Tax=Shewanella sp. SG41-4 TaxID=2760976 RepID=UPI001601F691|nr:LysR family transcriptional regulator [Shewanella sp. SG41-4]MBB1438977.1 LysR family transcriptional regulator [Shewanella sp. SG41-4]